MPERTTTLDTCHGRSSSTSVQEGPALDHYRTTGESHRARGIPHAEESSSRAVATIHVPRENLHNSHGAGCATAPSLACGPGDATPGAATRVCGSAVVVAPCAVSAASRDSARAYFLR